MVSKVTLALLWRLSETCRTLHNRQTPVDPSTNILIIFPLSTIIDPEPHGNDCSYNVFEGYKGLNLFPAITRVPGSKHRRDECQHCVQIRKCGYAIASNFFG